MKTTTVPAQVTTVEDRFAGNLNLTQLILLVSPIFISCAIYVMFPPLLKISVIKVSLSTLIFILFGVMSIRVKGKIVLMWLVLILRYRSRPRYYVFNKNDVVFRTLNEETKKETEVKEVEKTENESKPIIRLATPDLVRLETAIADPRANFNFKNKKGLLSVRITEIQ